MCLGMAQIMQGDLAGAVAQFGAVAAEAEAAHDVLLQAISLAHQGIALAWQGDTGAARAAADAGLEAAAEFGGFAAGIGYTALANAALAAGDVAAALAASDGGLAAPECPARVRGAFCAPIMRAGRTGGRGSDRGPPLGRRRRRDCAGLAPDGGADDARPRGDRPG